MKQRRQENTEDVSSVTYQIKSYNLTKSISLVRNWWSTLHNYMFLPSSKSR